MGLIILYLSIALGVSFLCSFLEAILLSTSSSYIAMKEREGARGIELLKELKTNIDRPISAILSLNTVAHTIGAAGVGAEAVRVFGEAYFGVISAVLTILILVLSEIIPKTIGATYWRVFSIPAARIIRAMIFICYPLVWLSELITKLVANPNRKSSVSREEVIAMIDTGVQEGVIESDESRIFQNVTKLGTVKVGDVMTPHIVTQTANADMTLKEFYQVADYKPYSRVPIYENDRDIIVGYVILKDLLERVADDKFDMKVRDIMRPIIAVHITDSLSTTWERMLQEREHICLVTDNYGSFEGIVTMEDIVESILGLEIIDERDTTIDMQQLAREKWHARAVKYKNFITN